jgi:hypothetical protein
MPSLQQAQGSKRPHHLDPEIACQRRDEDEVIE